jgi:hypothetical protein
MSFILGLIVGAALMALAFWLQRSRIAVKWYEWLMSGLGFILLLWAVNDFFASMAEHDERAGRVLLAMLGIPAVLLLGVGIFLAWRRWHTARMLVQKTS